MSFAVGDQVIFSRQDALYNFQTRGVIKGSPDGASYPVIMNREQCAILGTHAECTCATEGMYIYEGYLSLTPALVLLAEAAE